MKLKKNDIKEIVQTIQQGDSIPIEKQTRRATVHRVKYNDYLLDVLYDKQAKKLRTYVCLTDMV